MSYKGHKYGQLGFRRIHLDSSEGKKSLPHKEKIQIIQKKCIFGSVSAKKHIPRRTKNKDRRSGLYCF